VADRFADAYRHLLSQDKATITLSIPLKDWGKRKNAYSLSVAQSHWQTARQNQIASLQNYWLAYYHLRRLTLYDYQRRRVSWDGN